MVYRDLEHEQTRLLAPPVLALPCSFFAVFSVRDAVAENDVRPRGSAYAVIAERCLHLPQLRTEAVILAHERAFIAPLHELQKLLGLLNVVGERLLNEYVFACLDRFFRIWNMELVRQGDYHQIRLALERLVIIRAAHLVGDAPLFLCRFEIGPAAAHQRRQLTVGIVVYIFEPACCPAAAADLYYFHVITPL